MSPPSSVVKSKISNKPALRKQKVPPKRLLTFNGLHGIISQKIQVFITTAVRASDPVTITSALSNAAPVIYFLAPSVSTFN
jgi:hypothetical protein